MRITVCLLAAAFIACCSASDMLKKEFDALKYLEELMDERSKHHKHKEDDHDHDHAHSTSTFEESVFSKHVNKLMKVYVRHDANGERFIKCVNNVWDASDPKELEDSAKNPPNEVLEAISHLSTEKQKMFSDYNSAMVKIIRIMFECSRPKVSKELQAKRNEHHIPDLMELRRQYNATMLMLAMIKQNPANIAWKLLVYGTSVPPDIRYELVACVVGVHRDAIAHFDEEFATEIEAWSELSESDRAKVKYYFSKLYNVINEFIRCTTV